MQWAVNFMPLAVMAAVVVTACESRLHASQQGSIACQGKLSVPTSRRKQSGGQQVMLDGLYISDRLHTQLLTVKYIPAELPTQPG